MGRMDRAGLAFVFFMGSVSIIAALVRFATLKAVQNVPRAVITHTIDVWALVEIVSSILAVCAPSLRVFIRRQRSVDHGVQRLESEGGESRRSAVESVLVESVLVDREEDITVEQRKQQEQDFEKRLSEGVGWIRYDEKRGVWRT